MGVSRIGANNFQHANGRTTMYNACMVLYYFGMLSIDGTMRGETKLIIPNQVVCEEIDPSWSDPN